MKTILGRTEEEMTPFTIMQGNYGWYWRHWQGDNLIQSGFFIDSANALQSAIDYVSSGGLENTEGDSYEKQHRMTGAE